MADKRKGGGGKLSRTEIVTVRLDPKLRFGVELAGRKHRRTASSFIEWAVEQVLDQVAVRNWRGEETTIAEAHKHSWDVDESDRLVNLALYYPELLTHDEERIWKLILETQFFAKKEVHKNLPSHPLEPDRRAVREHWETLQKVAKGELTRDALPELPRGLDFPEFPGTQPT
jgi:hypothetical protein